MTSPRHAVAPRSSRAGAWRGNTGDWLAWLVWLFIAGLLLSRLLQFGGTPNRTVAVWQALLPWQMLASVPVLVLTVALRRWRTLAALSIAIIALLPLIGGWYMHGSRTRPGNRPTITLATANVLFSNTRLGAAFDDVAEADADVVVLSEMTGPGRRALSEHRLGSSYPFRSDDPYRIGIVVLSRYPLTDDAAGNWVTGESQALTIDVDGTEIRLIASHPPPPVFTVDVWDAELQMIGNDVHAFDAPTIVAGDLNAGWVLPPFREMVNTGGLTDAMGAAGHRWTMTWPTDHLLGIPYVTLDHILVNDQLGVFTADSFDVAGSDHKAIVAELVLPASELP